MAETAGIILFMLWYVGIAYNYMRDSRKQTEHNYSARSSEISLLAKANGQEDSDKEAHSGKALILDDIPVIKTPIIAQSIEPPAEYAESTVGDALEVVHAVKETIDEFDVEEVNLDETTDDE